jgi:hypothetical protein
MQIDVVDYRIIITMTAMRIEYVDKADPFNSPVLVHDTGGYLTISLPASVPIKSILHELVRITLNSGSEHKDSVEPLSIALHTGTKWFTIYDKVVW